MHKQIQSKGTKGISFQIESLPPPSELMEEVHGHELSQQFVASVSASAFAQETLVDFGSHAFLRSLHQAYADHRPFVISADMIWLLVLQGFSRHINYNNSLFAKKWGLSTEKETLSIRDDSLRPDSDAQAWEGVLLGLESLIQTRMGPKLVQELAFDFSSTDKACKIAGTITMLDSLKAFFDYVVFSCTCGIPSITLEGEQADWIQLKTKVAALKKYDLAWWIDKLIEPLEHFIGAFDGSIDQAFWQSIFKFHTVRSCGESNRIDGWITHFYPYDREGRRRAGRAILDIKDLPDEVVKVDFIHKYLCPQGEHAVPLQFVSGFVAASQNADNFALRPHISWMVAHPKPAERLLASQRQPDGLSFGNLVAFPESILGYNKLSSLSLSFLEEVIIPKDIAKLDIGLLSINGNISPRRLRKLARQLPNTYLEINGKQYVRPMLKRYLTQYRWINRIFWPEENQRLDWEAEMQQYYEQDQAWAQ
ncbi:MAG: DUF4419 domain-containing protein [Bacteroidota bacterium]